MPWFRRTPGKRELSDALLGEAIKEALAAEPIPSGALIYTPAGRVAHVKAALTEGAACRDMKDWPGPWLGTGSDGERERAASLPKCPRCEAVISKSEVA